LPSGCAAAAAHPLGKRFQKPSLTAFKDLTLQLADLYAGLVFDAALTEELRGLSNDTAIRQRFAH
jgi:hypothetical protein